MIRAAAPQKCRSLGNKPESFVFFSRPFGTLGWRRVAMGHPTRRRLFFNREVHMTTLPLWIWFAGAGVLGIVMAYGILRNRTRTREERIVTNEATKELYKQENRSS